MRKDVKVNATVDPAGAAILAVIADREAEGNRSQALRMVLREAADRRGLPHVRADRETAQRA